MKFRILSATVCGFIASISTSAQTNTFPGSGNVGIGTTTPTALLQVGQNTRSQSFKVSIVGNRANTNAEILGSLAVVGVDPTYISTMGAVAWDYYNLGNAPSWSGTLLVHNGTGVTTNGFGFPPANEGMVMFQNVSNGVIASNGANIHISPFGNPSASFLINGNVGIGTTTPGSKLQINTLGQSTDGAIILGGDGHWAILRASNPSGANNGITQAGDSGIIYSGGTQGTGAFIIAPWAAQTSGLRMDAAGNVGIGTANPGQKLSVNGTISAKEIIVQTTGWSDYVFDESYQLVPLSTVEKHIKQDKHLPGMPSAAEVAEHGVKIGDMQAKLLGKIEELTLHMIALEKENQILKTRMTLLEREGKAPSRE